MGMFEHSVPPNPTNEGLPHFGTNSYVFPVAVGGTVAVVPGLDTIWPLTILD